MRLRESHLHPSQFIGESSHWVHSMTLTDKAGMAIPVSALSTVTLTLIDLRQAPYGIVNGVDATNIKNDLVRGSISPQGVLTLTLLPGDTALLSATSRLERRRARIEWVKTGSGDVLWKELDLMIAPKPWRGHKEDETCGSGIR